MKLSLRARQELWAYAFMCVPLLFFAVIRIYPALFAVNVSLHDWGTLSTVRPFTGMRNYQALWSDTVFWKSLQNTFLYVIVGVPGQMLVGLAIALMLKRINRFVGFYRMLYFIPYVTSAVAVSWVWRWMYQQHVGLINQLFLWLDLPQQGFLESPSQALFSILAMVIWQSMGFMVVIFLAGLETIPAVHYEAAQIDGANRWQTFKSITLPLLNPTIVFAAVVSTIRMLQIFTEVMNMSREGVGGPLNSTISLVLYIYQIAFQQFRLGYASAATGVLFAVIIAITLLQMRVLTRRFDY